MSLLDSLDGGFWQLRHIWAYWKGLTECTAHVDELRAVVKALQYQPGRGAKG